MAENSVTILEPKIIIAEETYPVRHAVLRKGRALETCIFEGDKLSKTFHLGGFLGDTLVAVASFYDATHKEYNFNNAVQLRGMAVLDAYQGKGYGQIVLEYGETLAKEKKYKTIWMNARVSALAFYTKQNYHKVGTVFEIPLLGEHFVLYKKI